MIKRGMTVISFILFFSYSIVVSSHSVSDAKLQNVLQNLLVWLNGQNHFNYDNIPPPNISITNAEKMCELAFGKKSMHRNNNNECTNILGLYNFNNNTIYISHDLDLNSKEGQAVILHELVHHFQYKSGEADNVESVSQLEPYAYYLERKFNKQYRLLASNQHIH